MIRAFNRAATRYGVGSGASQLITGYSRPLQRLEQELADFTGRPRALLFSSGYLANIGVIGALVSRDDAVFMDRLNHASLVDAVIQSRSRFRRYPHGDCLALSRLLSASESRRKWVVTDGVFSMDGDMAALPQICAACRRFDAWLVVDDAHGLGVFGPRGSGTVGHFGLGPDDVPVLIGTFGKAFGVCGAFVAGSEALIETLVQSARSLIYSTAPLPAVAAAVREGLEIIRTESWRRQRLFMLVKRFRRGAREIGLPVQPSDGPIQPMILGASERAVHASHALLAQGILVPAIRPPTVPKGGARLRISLSASHTEAQIDRLLDAMSHDHVFVDP